MTVATAAPRRSRRRRILALVGFIGLLLVLWEGVKLVGGDPWRVNGQLVWTPPFDIKIARRFRSWPSRR